MTILRTKDTKFCSLEVSPTPSVKSRSRVNLMTDVASQPRFCEGIGDESAYVNDTGRKRLALALAVMVMLVLFGGVFAAAAAKLHSSGPNNNRALVDVSTTNEVTEKISDELTKVLSYRYDKPELSEKAASVLLTGPAKAQYEQLFSTLRKKSPGQKLVLQAKVVTAGVQFLRQDSAQLLVFVDQTTTRSSDKSRNAAAAQLKVTAVKNHDQWLISDLRTL